TDEPRSALGHRRPLLNCRPKLAIQSDVTPNTVLEIHGQATAAEVERVASVISGTEKVGKINALAASRSARSSEIRSEMLRECSSSAAVYPCSRPPARAIGAAPSAKSARRAADRATVARPSARIRGRRTLPDRVQGGLRVKAASTLCGREPARSRSPQVA